MVFAAGEGVTPTRKDRCSHRGKGFPSPEFRLFQRAESTVSPSGEP